MTRIAAALCTLAAVVLSLAVLTVPAQASTSPVVTGLSNRSGPYWGDSVVTVYGLNFSHVTSVLFGAVKGRHVHVGSATTLTVTTPWHGYGTVNVRVITTAGTSPKIAADSFAFARPTMSTPIQGGLTGRQEQHISARVRATHRTVRSANRANRWTAAMGLTAQRRAASWIGLPYSWAGGSSRGPTAGACAHNGGDLDCHIVGFDCSGLSLYSWAPYSTLAHYAQTQHSRAGRFHPTIGQLMPGDLVFFAGYLPEGIGHVAVYAGGGTVIEAAESGTLVRRSRLADVIADNGGYRGATRPMSVGRQGAVPSLTALTPSISTQGGTIVITGRQLSAATSVSIGATMIYSFGRTASGLVVKAPAHAAGAVAVVVSTAWGSATSTVTYVAPAQASTLAPATGPASGGTAVTVTGSNLATVSKVTVGGTPVAFARVAPNQLTLTTPAHAAGPATVTLYSTYGTSRPVTFTYTADPVPPPHPTPSPSPTPTLPPTPTPSLGTAEPSPTGTSSDGPAVPSAADGGATPTGSG